MQFEYKYMTAKISTILKNDQPTRHFYIWGLFLFLCFYPLTLGVYEEQQSPGAGGVMRGQVVPLPLSRSPQVQPFLLTNMIFRTGTAED